MALIKLNPKSSLNKAFLKVKPNRVEIEKFKSHLISLLDNINETESEEFHKNLISEFLKKTYYDPSYYINTKGRNDLVIHNGKEAKDSVAVIIEAKKPTNKAEMLKQENINTKAFQELVLYFLRERITHKNHEIKCLVATNINEWFIFDATVFEKNFAQNKALVAKFNDFVDGRLSGDTTDFFYKEIAQPAIAAITSDIEFTYFDIREYDKPLRNENKQDDNKLISLFKLLSPEHLLKLPFINDSNTLDKRFYSELLHIIGLVETKDGSKRLIKRKDANERDSGSLLENAVDQIDSLDKLSRFDNLAKYGANKEERLFNIGLELVITWVNRILFLKLLEAQLLSYHKGDNSYSFLNQIKITNFDDLNSLFFQVLARKSNERNSDVKKLFAKVPYLNSSLFEPTDIEHTALFISNLRDDKKIPVLTSTVLKDSTGNKFRGELSTLEYLFKFLDAYDFASEGAEEIQEENKSLINASVLGLIFEKINGYKDGSFFTPGFITMYMSRETIRRAVVQKFNEVKGWKCETIEDLYNQIEDRKEANDIINSLKICDPAVGSGHFLVSALNELISIKSDLKVLLDQDGKRLKEYQVIVVNDELIIFDEDGDFFEYKPSNNESQRVQVALFNEKQTIIENCLFGVDINPNSVKICRLRLWIELLKNAYYKNSEELETLPNIDINIKCGNSLISRFELNSDLKEALKKSKITISSYKKAVDTYRNANSKEQKREMEKLIEDIKNNFRVEIYSNDPKIKKLDRLKNEYGYLSGQSSLFDETVKERKLRKQKIVDLQTEINKIGSEIELIKSNKIYQNAFEWRFEFPEILNNSGEFTGFDIVIGNPPYFKEYTNRTDFEGIPYYQGKMDIWYSFACRGIDFLKTDGHLAFIATNNWTTSSGASVLRNKIIRETQIESLIDFSTYMVFDSAAIQTMIIQIKKNSEKDKYLLDFRKFISNKVDLQDAKKLLSNINSDKIEFISAMLRREDYVDSFLVFGNNEENKLLEKIKNKLNFNLYDGEVIQGIVSPQDFLNKKNALKINKHGLQAGVGIFVLTDSEKESLQLTNDELGLIKPLYTTNEMARYSLTSTNNSWIIYTGSEFKKSDSMDSYPNLKSHLDKFNTIITSDNKPYGLHRSRNKDFFIGDKIISLRKATTPTFTFTSCDCYVSQTFNIIKSNRINLKYLTGLLNSDLVRYWLKNKGKMQGDLYQVDKEPLLEIPIYQHGNPFQLANLVDQVIDTIKQGGEISDLESSINILVCKYYDLDYSEYQHITNNNLVTKDYYDNFLIN